MWRAGIFVVAGRSKPKQSSIPNRDDGGVDLEKADISLANATDLWPRVIMITLRYAVRTLTYSEDVAGALLTCIGRSECWEIPSERYAGSGTTSPTARCETR